MVWQPLSAAPVASTRKPNDFGKGKPIHLKTNFFEVGIKNPNIDLIHYHVDFKDTNMQSLMLPKKKRMLIFQEMKKAYPKVFRKVLIGFDSEKNAYGTSVIFQEEKGDPMKIFETNIEEGGQARKYLVCMKAVHMENLSTLLKGLNALHSDRVVPQNIIQMLEVLFQHNLSLQYERIGRNNFFSTGGEFGRTFGIGGGKEGLVGFFGSLRPVGWKESTLLLNIDIAHAAFYKEQSLIELMSEILNIDEEHLHRPLDPKLKKKLLQELRNLRIQVTHAPVARSYKVQDIGELGADRQTFPQEIAPGKTRQCTVQEYFLSQYKKKLKYPGLNVLLVGPPKRNIYMPIECCKVARGQRVSKKMTDRETSNFLRATAKNPCERLGHISTIMNKQQFSKDPIMKGLDLSVSDQPIQVNGHVLPAPQLIMSEEFPPVKGVWDLRNKTFFIGAKLGCWAVVNYDSNVQKDQLLQFLGHLKKMGQDRGMIIDDPKLYNCRNPEPEKDIPRVKASFPQIQLIMIVLPKFGDYYARIKKVGDRDLALMTQCIKSLNVLINGTAVVSNLLLKINTKIGGTNNIVGSSQQLLVFNAPVMIMGADVNHPPAHDKATPSLAAVVASIDRHASKYAVEVRHQKHRAEIILDLKEMTKNLLVAFYRKTKRKPERIIMYRDGVSESQFSEVLSSELKAMRNACTELEGSYEPSMTFIVVQKRHHTRLFCSNIDGVGKAGNVPPGTTVDHTITHPTQKDFYLCSHQGIVGTSRPTHYHVLWDDSDLPMELLQNLTYAMCHLYSRCTRSVSIPTPAYYAHLVAFRAKVHIRDVCTSENSSLASGETDLLSDDVMTRAARIDRFNEIASKLYFV